MTHGEAVEGHVTIPKVSRKLAISVEQEVKRRLFQTAILSYCNVDALKVLSVVMKVAALGNMLGFQCGNEVMLLQQSPSSLAGIAPGNKIIASRSISRPTCTLFCP
eukprot:2410089-Amphidinium_carterae.1